MGKGHYYGGGTLGGFGTTTSSKGRRGGINTTSVADKQRARLAEKKRRKALADQLATNEKLVKQLSDQWLAEKGRKHYDRLVGDSREKVSPLAAELRKAMAAAGEDAK